jgi:hypothetical protein
MMACKSNLCFAQHRRAHRVGIGEYGKRGYQTNNKLTHRRWFNRSLTVLVERKRLWKANFIESNIYDEQENSNNPLFGYSLPSEYSPATDNV